MTSTIRPDPLARSCGQRCRTHGTLKERPVDRFEHEIETVLKPLELDAHDRSFVDADPRRRRSGLRLSIMPRIEVQRRPHPTGMYAS